MPVPNCHLVPNKCLVCQVTETKKNACRSRVCAEYFENWLVAVPLSDFLPALSVLWRLTQLLSSSFKNRLSAYCLWSRAENHSWDASQMPLKHAVAQLVEDMSIIWKCNADTPCEILGLACIFHSDCPHPQMSQKSQFTLLYLNMRPINTVRYTLSDYT